MIVLFLFLFYSRSPKRISAINIMIADVFNCVVLPDAFGPDTV
jgi:hypothetical protein